MGTLSVTYVSNRIVAHKGAMKMWMVGIGNNTLAILTWHFISFKLVSLLIISVHHLPIEHLAEFPVIEDYAHIYWPIYLLAGIGVSLLIGQIEVRSKNLVANIKRNL